MIIKEKYTKSANLNNLSGSIIFFANSKFEIKNTKSLLSSSQNNLIKKNLKNNNKKKKFFLLTLAIVKKLSFTALKTIKVHLKKTGQNY